MFACLFSQRNKAPNHIDQHMRTGRSPDTSRKGKTSPRTNDSAEDFESARASNKLAAYTDITIKLPSHLNMTPDTSLMMEKKSQTEPQEKQERRTLPVTDSSTVQRSESLNGPVRPTTELELLLDHEARRRKRIETQADGSHDPRTSLNACPESSASNASSWCPRLRSPPSMPPSDDSSFRAFPPSQVLPNSEAFLGGA
jgi:hypothetical protein